MSKFSQGYDHNPGFTFKNILRFKKNVLRANFGVGGGARENKTIKFNAEEVEVSLNAGAWNFHALEISSSLLPHISLYFL
jgi:hypothetical protein